MLLVSLMVSPHPPWAVFWWHHSIINLVMQLSLPSTTGWTSVKCKFDFLSLSPTLSSPFYQWMDIVCLTLILFINVFLSPCISVSTSSLNACCWCNLIISCCASSINKTSSPIVGRTLTEFRLTLDLKIFLCLRIHATNLFIFLQSDISVSNLSKIPSFMEMVWTFISLLTSGSSSWISSNEFCLGHWNSHFHINSGPLNQRSRCFLFDPVKPRDVQPAGFIFDGT